MVEVSPSKQIDAIVEAEDDWRGEMLARLRTVVSTARPGIVEEVKWKKPSKPEGVPVWSCNGIICVADLLKSAVRLTFPNGALLSDPKTLFNTRLDSKSVRAIDFAEGARVNSAALRALVAEAVKWNTNKQRTT